MSCAGLAVVSSPVLPCASLRCHLLLAVDMDMVAMYEDAYKQQPANEELGTQTFFANVRIGNWKAAQQVSPSFVSEVFGH